MYILPVSRPIWITIKAGMSITHPATATTVIAVTMILRDSSSHQTSANGIAASTAEISCEKRVRMRESGVLSGVKCSFTSKMKGSCVAFRESSENRISTPVENMDRIVSDRASLFGVS